MKKLNLQGLLPFQSQTAQSTLTQSSIKSMLSSLQNGRCFSATLFLQPPLQSPSTIPSPTSANFHLFVSPLYFSTKPSLQSSPALPSPIPQPFFTSLFVHTAITTTLTKNCFPIVDHSGWVKGSVSKSILFGLKLLISPYLSKAWTGIKALTITDSYRSGSKYWG